jgi:hypothetical protein
VFKKGVNVALLSVIPKGQEGTGSDAQSNVRFVCVAESSAELADCEEVHPSQVRVHDSTAKTPHFHRIG